MKNYYKFMNDLMKFLLGHYRRIYTFAKEIIYRESIKKVWLIEDNLFKKQICQSIEKLCLNYRSNRIVWRLLYMKISIL
jgi:hypothetical protein